MPNPLEDLTGKNIIVDDVPMPDQKVLEIISGTGVAITATDDSVNGRTVLEFERTSEGAGGDAEDVAYDNTTSGLVAEDVQAALDELAAAVDDAGTISGTATSGQIAIGTGVDAIGSASTLTTTGDATNRLVVIGSAAATGNAELELRGDYASVELQNAAGDVLGYVDAYAGETVFASVGQEMQVRPETTSTEAGHNLSIHAGASSFAGGAGGLLELAGGIGYGATNDGGDTLIRAGYGGGSGTNGVLRIQDANSNDCIIVDETGQIIITDGPEIWGAASYVKLANAAGSLRTALAYDGTNTALYTLSSAAGLNVYGYDPLDVTIALAPECVAGTDVANSASLIVSETLTDGYVYSVHCEVWSRNAAGTDYKTARVAWVKRVGSTVTILEQSALGTDSSGTALVFSDGGSGDLDMTFTNTTGATVKARTEYSFTRVLRPVSP